MKEFEILLFVIIVSLIISAPLVSALSWTGKFWEFLNNLFKSEEKTFIGCTCGGYQCLSKCDNLGYDGYESEPDENICPTDDPGCDGCSGCVACYCTGEANPTTTPSTTTPCEAKGYKCVTRGQCISPNIPHSLWCGAGKQCCEIKEETCLNKGYHCCSTGCASGHHSEYDDSCGEGYQCCETCKLPTTTPPTTEQPTTTPPTTSLPKCEGFDYHCMIEDCDNFNSCEEDTTHICNDPNNLGLKCCKGLCTPSTCFYNNKVYHTNDEICDENIIKRCKNMRWEEIKRCSDGFDCVEENGKAKCLSKRVCNAIDNEFPEGGIDETICKKKSDKDPWIVYRCSVYKDRYEWQLDHICYNANNCVEENGKAKCLYENKKCPKKNEFLKEAKCDEVVCLDKGKGNYEIWRCDCGTEIPQWLYSHSCKNGCFDNKCLDSLATNIENSNVINEYIGEECGSGIWIALNKEGSPLSYPIVEKYENNSQLEFKIKNKGKVNIIFVCFDNLSMKTKVIDIPT